MVPKKAITAVKSLDIITAPDYTDSRAQVAEIGDIDTSVTKLFLWSALAIGPADPILFIICRSQSFTQPYTLICWKYKCTIRGLRYSIGLKYKGENVQMKLREMQKSEIDDFWIFSAPPLK